MYHCDYEYYDIIIRVRIILSDLETYIPGYFRLTVTLPTVSYFLWVSLSHTKQILYVYACRCMHFDLHCTMRKKINVWKLRPDFSLRVDASISLSKAFCLTTASFLGENVHTHCKLHFVATKLLKQTLHQKYDLCQPCKHSKRVTKKYHSVCLRRDGLVKVTWQIMCVTWRSSKDRNSGKRLILHDKVSYLPSKQTLTMQGKRPLIIGVTLK